MSKIVVIVGPTGSGKTKLSINLALKMNAEIINTDRMAMYKETNIGTAKIKDAEMNGIVHHLINNISLDDEYTIFNFQKDGRQILNKLIEENKNIIIVGGSGLYIKALLYDYELNDEKKTTNETSYSNEELKKIADSISINNIHVNNRNRLIRFINAYKSGNKIINSENKNKPLYEFVTIGLTMERKVLYNLINKRVDDMVKGGLLEEARSLYAKNYSSLTKIIGYKELIPYFNNEIRLEEAIDIIKTNTRHYAKRQYTWYNNQMNNINWFEVNIDNFDETIKKIEAFLISF